MIKFDFDLLLFCVVLLLFTVPWRMRRAIDFTRLVQISNSELHMERSG